MDIQSVRDMISAISVEIDNKLDERKVLRKQVKELSKYNYAEIERYIASMSTVQKNCIECMGDMTTAFTREYRRSEIDRAIAVREYLEQACSRYEMLCSGAIDPVCAMLNALLFELSTLINCANAAFNQWSDSVRES